MNVLLIGYDEALTQYIETVLNAGGYHCNRLSVEQAIDPNFLSDKVDWAGKIVFVTSDTFMGLDVDLSNALEAATDVIDELLLKSKSLIHINSTLALGRGKKGESLTADSDWTDNLDWNEQAYLLHRIDREFWRGIAEGLQGCSLLVPVVQIDIDEQNAATKKIQEFALAGVYPTGNTGFLSERSFKEIFIKILEADIWDQTRYLSVDRSSSYQSWITESLSDESITATMQPMPSPKYGIWAWIDKMLGRSNRLSRGYIHLLTSELSYSSSKMKA